MQQDGFDWEVAKTVVLIGSLAFNLYASWLVHLAAKEIKRLQSRADDCESQSGGGGGA